MALTGGTADIIVHRVDTDDTVCEIHGASGGAWGGIRVNILFYHITTLVSI